MKAQIVSRPTVADASFPAFNQPEICSGVHPSARRSQTKPQFLIFFEYGSTPPAQLIAPAALSGEQRPLKRPLRRSSRDTMDFAR